jgi:hypothetical protein
VAWGLDHISSLELTEWQALASEEPFGDARGDYQAGVVASSIYNIYRDRDKKPEPFKVGDFMPEFWEERKPFSENARPNGEQLLAKMRAMFPPIPE